MAPLYALAIAFAFVLLLDTTQNKPADQLSGRPHIGIRVGSSTSPDVLIEVSTMPATPLRPWSLPARSTMYLVDQGLVGRSVCLQVPPEWTVKVNQPKIPKGGVVPGRSCSQPIADPQPQEILFTVSMTREAN